LLFDLGRLISYQLQLSDPLDPARARLIYPGTASASRPQNQPVIRLVLDAVQEHPLESHQQFLALLERLRLKLVAPPARGSRARPTDPQQLDAPLAYPGMVGIRTDTVPGVVFFGGPLCRPGFTRDDWSRRIKARADAARALAQGPEQLYAVWVRRLEERIQKQQQRYPLPAGGHAVSIDEFAWLSRPRQETRAPRVTGAQAAEGTAQNATSTASATAEAMQPHGNCDNPFLYHPPVIYPYLDEGFTRGDPGCRGGFPPDEDLDDGEEAVYWQPLLLGTAPLNQTQDQNQVQNQDRGAGPIDRQPGSDVPQSLAEAPPPSTTPAGTFQSTPGVVASGAPAPPPAPAAAGDAVEWHYRELRRRRRRRCMQIGIAIAEDIERGELVHSNPDTGSPGELSIL
jgi:hypothetical protein